MNVRENHKLFVQSLRMAWILALTCALTAGPVNSAYSQDAESGEAHSEAAHESHDAQHEGDHADGDHGHDEAGHGHDDHGAGHGTGHGDEHAAPSIWEDLSFWSIIAFAGFCFAIGKLGIWDWMLTSMSDREAQEQETISVAERHLSTARETLNKYRGQLEAMDETVAETLAEAKRDADHTRNEIVEFANHEAGLMVKRAEVDIDRARDQSLHQLFEHLAARVAEVSEQRVRSSFNDSDQDRLIDETLNQMAGN